MIQTLYLRQAVLFLLSAVFMFSATELHQLIRLPQLVVHYHEHKSANPTLSLLGFLQLHYTADHPVDNDEGEDTRLPFKTTDAISHVDFSLSISRLEQHPQPEFATVVYQITHPEGNPCHRSYGVFRPPQATKVI